MSQAPVKKIACKFSHNMWQESTVSMFEKHLEEMGIDPKAAVERVRSRSRARSKYPFNGLQFSLENRGREARSESRRRKRQREVMESAERAQKRAKSSLPNAIVHFPSPFPFSFLSPPSLFLFPCLREHTHTHTHTHNKTLPHANKNSHTHKQKKQNTHTRQNTQTYKPSLLFSVSLVSRGGTAHLSNYRLKNKWKKSAGKHSTTATRKHEKVKVIEAYQVLSPSIFIPVKEVSEKQTDVRVCWPHSCCQLLLISHYFLRKQNETYKVLICYTPLT